MGPGHRAAVRVHRDRRRQRRPSRLIEEQLAELRAQLETVESDRTKKRIELAVKSAHERLERLIDQARKDQGLSVENSGCDYLFIDEAHMYKNKARVCNIEELSSPNSSQRAEDLTLELRILRQRRRDEALAGGIPAGKVVERVATFATGTPIANSLGELWVMQSYLVPTCCAPPASRTWGTGRGIHRHRDHRRSQLHRYPAAPSNTGR